MKLCALAILVAASGVLETEPPATAPPVAFAAADAAPALPETELTSIPGFQNDEAYQRASEERARDWVAQAKQATDVSTRISFLLAAANDLIACRVEPLGTYRLLGVDRNTETAVATLDQVASLVEDAEAAFDGWSTTEEDKDEVRMTKSRVEAVAAFAGGLRAYLAVEPDEKASRRAASALAVLLEDENDRVAAAAGLWQAALRAQAVGPARGLSVLDGALSEPRRRTLPYAFFARLLRCRLLAERGDHAVALALLIQIEDQCDVWIPKRNSRDDALRAIGVVRILVLRDWFGKLDQSDRRQERKWCVDRIAMIVADRLPEGQRQLFRLVETVPIVAPPPAQTVGDTGGS